MKTITIWDKKIELNVGENLTVKEMRIIYPLTAKNTAGWEIEMVIEIIKALSSQSDVEDVINSMSIDEFAKLSEKVSEIIDQKKK